MCLTVVAMRDLYIVYYGGKFLASPLQVINIAEIIVIFETFFSDWNIQVVAVLQLHAAKYQQTDKSNILTKILFNQKEFVI